MGLRLMGRRLTGRRLMGRRLMGRGLLALPGIPVDQNGRPCGDMLYRRANGDSPGDGMAQAP